MSDRKLTTHERRAQHVRAFDQVTEMYTNLILNHEESTTPRGVTKGSRVVAPSTCDFICDVELTASSVLNKMEYVLFSDVYRYTRKEEKDIPVEILEHIKSRVGQLFLSRQIYPTQRYFRGKAIN